jgi:hypothetical protein
LQRHSDYARPILGSLAKVAEDKERAAATAALGLLDSGPPTPIEALSEERVEAELGSLFARLGEELAKTKSKRARVAAIKAAHERYAEIRSAGGDPVPEAYFTHSLGDFGLGEYTPLAIEVAGEE